MSELQLSLIGIGILVVAGVFGFNWYQERQFRRRVENSFQQRPDDILLEPAAARGNDDERIEPHIGTPTVEAAEVQFPPLEAGDEAGAAPSRPNVVAAPVREPVPVPSPIDYVCSIEASSTFPHPQLNQFLQSVSAIGKPVTVTGLNAHTSQWVALPCGAEIALCRVHASLQLADRTGPVNRVQLSSLRDLAHRLAEQADGACQCPEIDKAAQAAAEIDRFCAQVDISIGCNVVPSANGVLSGTKVRGLLESAGFALEPSGRFILYSEDGGALISVEDIDGETLSAERLRSAPLAGLTLTMDVPRVPAGTRVFDRMLELARHLAHALDASVVDDNRVELTEAGLNVIRQQLRTVHGAMEAQGIPAGGLLAARLFS